MKYLLFTASVVSVLAGCAVQPSSVTPMGSVYMLTQAPQFSGGQQWTYNRIDLWKKEEVERFSQTFNTQSNQKWSVAWAVLNSSDETRLGITIEQFDANTHGFADPRMTGHYAPLKFPLAPGKKWTFSYNFQSKPDTLIEVTQTALVTRWEDVSVPAGKFKTLRVDHVGNYQATQGVQSWRGRITETFWYAPEIGRVVAQEYKDTNGRGATWDQRRDELVAMRK